MSEGKYYYTNIIIKYSEGNAILTNMYVHVLPARPSPPATYSQSRIFFVNNFLNLIVAIFRGLWFNTLKMNEEQTFQFGPFEVTVFPATNEEDEWVEVVEN